MPTALTGDDRTKTKTEVDLELHIRLVKFAQRALALLADYEEHKGNNAVCVQVGARFVEAAVPLLLVRRTCHVSQGECLRCGKRACEDRRVFAEWFPKIGWYCVRCD